jgi:hypothetical protein
VRKVLRALLNITGAVNLCKNFVARALPNF